VAPPAPADTAIPAPASPATAPATANLIYVTHPSREGDIKAVLDQIQASGILSADPLLLRIMD
jgi:hypothetical protein